MRLPHLCLTISGVALMLMLACSTAAARPPVPDDGKDDLNALQAQIDKVAQAGGGVVQLERGTYDLSAPLYLRSGVKLTGRGPETILSNARFNQRWRWLGTTIFAGNLTPASYFDNDGKGYPGMPFVRINDRAVVARNCDPALFRGLAGSVVWINSERTITGAGGYPRPEHGVMNVVESVTGCSLSLADPIGIPDNGRLEVHWSNGSKRLPDVSGEPNRPIRDAGLADLQVISANAQALLISCYRCTFTNLTIGRTRRLIALEGSRFTTYRNIQGAFTERGIEIVMFASDNVVQDVQARYQPGFHLAPRPAIRFGEFARRNAVRNVTLDLANAYTDATKIRFDASFGNELSDITLITSNADERPILLFAGTPGTVPGSSPALVKNVRLCTRNGACRNGE